MKTVKDEKPKAQDEGIPAVTEDKGTDPVLVDSEMDPTSHELAPQAPAAIQTAMESEGLDSSDLQLPRLSIVQAVGPLSEKFKPGQLVLAGEHVLANPQDNKGESVELVVLAKPRKTFVENLPYGTEQRPQVFNNPQEVANAGGTLEWVGKTAPSYVPVATAICLVRTDDDRLIMKKDPEGKGWTVAIWSIRGTAYPRAAKPLFTAMVLKLGGHMPRAKWTLSAVREKVGTNWVWVPVLTDKGRNTPEFVAFAESALS